MRTVVRISFFVLILLFSINVVVEAQFLGQQSLSQSSYVIDQSGQLWAWGDNFYGQLGVGDRTNRNTPTLVPLPEGASKWVLVAGGANFAIAVADSDKLYTWGLNDKGQIGNGTPDGLYAVPTRIQNPPYTTTWKWVSAGAAHCEALTTDGRLFAWGNNTQGELGVGTTEYVITPQEVQFPTGISAWADVAAGPGYTMMLTPDGLLYGCGMDSLTTFQPREGPVLGEIDPFRAISPLPCIGASYRLETMIDGYYFAGPAYNEYYVGPDGGSPDNMAAVADGGWHALLLNVSGTLVTAGDNTYGQLGIGPGTNVRNGTIKVPSGVTQFVAIAAGLKHSLAIANDGWLYAWGDNSVGELGIGNDTSKSKPVRVLQVCSPLAMTASFIAPKTLDGPYTITLNIHDGSASSPLTNTDAFLVLNTPLTYLDGGPNEPYTPQILPHDTGSLSWNITDFTNLVLDTPIYFAYIRANGSSPLLISGRTIVPPEWVTAYVYGSVVDSITGKAISDADVLVSPPIGSVGADTTNQAGSFVDTLRLLDRFTYEIVKENYNSNGSDYEELDSLDYETFTLGPSNVQGTFTVPGTPFLADSIQKVYYPDSLIGYALSRRAIFRTLDSGIDWSEMYVAHEDLHDVKYIDPAHGWVVGDGGTILNTTDSGNTWQLVQVGTQNLLALAVIDFDTAWAVGEHGTVLKKSGDTWNVMPPLGTNDLTAVHFLNAEAGVIGTTGGYYLYRSGNWAAYYLNYNFPNPIPKIRAVYYTPSAVFLAGNNGYIFNAGSQLYTNTTQNINSLYFLNSAIGYALGDSGSSLVTYDGGASWAPMHEFPHNATSINFFSLNGHGASDNGVLNYDGAPSVVNAIVRGRITYGNPPEPIMGAEIDRYYMVYYNGVPLYNYIDTTYTNEQGNFVFSGIDGFFSYQYLMHFTDSGIAKTELFSNIQGHRHEITTLNYNDYTPPPPDTILADVPSGSEPNLSLEVSASESIARIEYSIPADGPVRLVMQDVLGRAVRMISDGFHSQGSSELNVSLVGLAAGAYYITLQSGESSLTKKLVVLR